TALNVKSLNIGNLVACGDKRPKRRKPVETLSANPLAIAKLKVARAHVVYEAIPENIVQRIGLAHHFVFVSDDHRQLRLIVNLSADPVQHYRRIVSAQRICQLVENERRSWRLRSAFDSVIDIVAADRQNLAWIYCRQEPHQIERIQELIRTRITALCGFE